MDFLSIVILSVVDGLTEFLPISSTAHLILTSRLLGLPPSDFLKSFEIAIQMGAIGAVVVLYGKSMRSKGVLKSVGIAFLPTAAIGLFLYKIIKHNFMENYSLILWSLFLGGAFLIIFELWHGSKAGSQGKAGLSEIRPWQAFVIGVFQSLAVIPGVSRAGATIIGGLILGINRKTIVEFSFLLAIPTMCAATFLDLIKSAEHFTSSQIGYMLTGFVISFAVAVFSIKFLLQFIKTHNFIPFGIYRMAAAILFGLVVIK